MKVLSILPHFVGNRRFRLNGRNKSQFRKCRKWLPCVYETFFQAILPLRFVSRIVSIFYLFLQELFFLLYELFKSTKHIS